MFVIVYKYTHKEILSIWNFAFFPLPFSTILKQYHSKTGVKFNQSDDDAIEKSIPNIEYVDIRVF